MSVDGTDKWFHSDTFSRNQRLGLVIMAFAMPASLQWKTMDGTFVPMTPALAQQIFNAAALFGYAEQLMKAVDESADPTSIAITTGWPVCYLDLVEATNAPSVV